MGAASFADAERFVDEHVAAKLLADIAASPVLGPLVAVTVRSLGRGLYPRSRPPTQRTDGRACSSSSCSERIASFRRAAERPGSARSHRRSNSSGVEIVVMR